MKFYDLILSMDEYCIETEVGELNIGNLTSNDMDSINEIAADILRQGKIICPRKAFLCGFIKWMDLLVFLNEKRNPETDCLQ